MHFCSHPHGVCIINLGYGRTHISHCTAYTFTGPHSFCMKFPLNNKIGVYVSLEPYSSPLNPHACLCTAAALCGLLSCWRLAQLIQLTAYCACVRVFVCVNTPTHSRTCVARSVSLSVIISC